MENFSANLERFLTSANIILAKHNSKHEYTRANPYTLECDYGTKYIRLVAVQHGHRSAWGFIDKTNGNVLKAACWKAPAKNFARGNIADAMNGVARAHWSGIA